MGYRTDSASHNIFPSEEVTRTTMNSNGNGYSDFFRMKADKFLNVNWGYSLELWTSGL